MKYLVLIISFSILASLALCETKQEFLSDNLIEIIENHQFPQGSSFFINLQMRETEALNLFFLQQKLLENGLIVLESDLFADYSVTIRGDERFKAKKKESFFGRDELYVETEFLVQIVQMSNMQVWGVERLLHESKHHEIESDYKWYTPFLLAFALGSFIYLLFYGS